MSEQKTPTEKIEDDAVAIGCVSSLVALGIGLTLIGILSDSFWGAPLALGVGVGVLSFVACFILVSKWASRVANRRAQAMKGKKEKGQ